MRWITLAFFLCRPMLASAATPPLSLHDAIGLAVEHNLTALLSRAETRRARSKTLESAVSLLPQLMGTMSQQRVYRENLAALGFNFSSGGFPSMLGPYNVFDARLHLVQTLFDAESWSLWRSAQSDARAASSEEALAAEQVSGAAALAYIESLRARRTIVAAQAGEDLAVQLMTLAREEKKAGAAAGIDVARAETREAEERLRLLDAKTASNDADLRLKRLLGLAMGEPVVLADLLTTVSTGSWREADAQTAAFAGRWELKVASARLESQDDAVRAAKLERLPTVTAAGDVGLSGVKPNSTARTTGSLGVGLSLPIFDGRRAEAKTREAKSSQDEASERLSDMRLQVEEDVRHSLDTLDESAERAQTAALAVTLAERELELARGRFSAGVGDNVEVVDAQAKVARDEDAQTAALAGLWSARVNLALALGVMKDFSL